MCTILCSVECWVVCVLNPFMKLHSMNSEIRGVTRQDRACKECDSGEVEEVLTLVINSHQFVQ